MSVVFVFVCAGTSWSQAVSPPVDRNVDTLLRAAYCVGVLSERLKQHKERTEQGEKEICAKWMETKFRSAAECAEWTAAVVQYFSETLESHKKRYARYVAARMSEVPSRSITR